MPTQSTTATTTARPARPKGVNWRPAYLAALIATGMKKRAAEAAGISRVTAWQERKRNPAFAAAAQEAEEQAGELLEDGAFERAVHGLRKYRFTSKGTPVFHPVTGEPYYDAEYSDSLLALLLKARLPERYRDRVEHTGALTHRHLTLDEMEARMRDARA